MAKSPSVHFRAERDAPFFQVLKARVRAYVTQQPAGRSSGRRGAGKALVCFAILLLPYGLLLSRPLPFWAQAPLWMIMGLGMALVGANVMHEACHGAWSRHRGLNALASLSAYLLGADKLVWQTSHNILHHRYTNIPGHDIDLDAGKGILRFSPETPWRPLHRWQHLCAFALYSLLTLTWVLLTDYLKQRRFAAEGLFYQKQTHLPQIWARLIFYKIVAYFIWLVIPLWLMPAPAWQTLAGFLLMHLVAGTLLTLIFQLAHLTPVNAMPVPDAEGGIDQGWAGHQLHTTANWAMHSPLLNWACGGLNFQIEHHLFPYIRHVHYPELAPIVQQTAEEYGLPYYAYDTLGQALRAHYQHLRLMGRRPAEQAVRSEMPPPPD
ncbi:MAG: acyl-CoA desaturase [Bacteroidetes bacterium]|nr:MAG: acyl-CoA desaturase [Bacteroidota bacterium]